MTYTDFEPGEVRPLGSAISDVVHDPVTGDYRVVYERTDDGTQRWEGPVDMAASSPVTITVAGGLTATNAAVTLDQPLPPGSLTKGTRIRVADPDAPESVTVGAVGLVGGGGPANDWIATFTPARAFAEPHTGPTVLCWRAPARTHLRHVLVRPAFAGDPAAGFALAIDKLVICPDGSTRILGRTTTSPQGVTGLAPGSVNGSHLQFDYPLPATRLLTNVGYSKVGNYAGPETGALYSAFLPNGVFPGYAATLMLTASQVAALMPGGLELAIRENGSSVDLSWGQAFGFIPPGIPSGTGAPPVGVFGSDTGAGRPYVIGTIPFVQLNRVGNQVTIGVQLCGINAANNPNVDVYVRWAGLTTGD